MPLIVFVSGGLSKGTPGQRGEGLTNPGMRSPKGRGYITRLTATGGLRLSRKRMNAMSGLSSQFGPSKSMTNQNPPVNRFFHFLKIIF